MIKLHVQISNSGEKKKENQKFTIKDKVIIGNPNQNEETQGLSTLILQSLTKYPDFIGQINANTGEKTTFSEIKERSIRCALWLKKQGIGKNDVVCVSTNYQTDDAIPILATFFVGAILSPWYHEVAEVVASRLFDMVQPKIVFADEKSIDQLYKVAEKAKATCKFVVIGKHPNFQSLRDLIAQQTKEEVNNFKHYEPENPKSQIGALFFSSGTTGDQKGIMLSYDTLVKHRMEYLHIRPGMIALWNSSLCWTVGTNMLTFCLRKCITRIILNNFEAEETSRIIQKYKVSFTFFFPSVVTRLHKEKAYSRYDFSSLETLVIGGSKPNEVVLSETHKALPHTLVTNSFGMTELGGCATLQSKKFTKIDSIGYIVEGVKMKVIDVKTGEKLGPNQEGELCFTVDNMMLGYWKNPEETKKMIDEDGWLHTGDLGCYDESGEISITSRLKEIILHEKVNIIPSEVENILLKHPAVADAAVVPVPHQYENERALAFVVKCPKAEVTAEELQEFPASINKYYRLTGGVIFIEKIPYTSTGKKHLRVLKEMAEAYAQ